MYFPYFRGRQYELLALKELATNRLISKAITPIVEPVKLIPALSSSLSAFVAANLPIGLILNPNVGDLADEAETMHQLIEKHCTSRSSIIPSVLVIESASAVFDELRKTGASEDAAIVVLGSRDYLDIYNGLFSDKQPQFTLCADDRTIRRTVSTRKVLFEDHFNKRNRNADYLGHEDEMFSEDHLYYEEELYSGFGDYSIVGSEYIESGFAPYAVAIHIVYFAPDKTLRIRHFISDSNEDISDVAGKFYEAVSKLYKWYVNGNERQLTTGLKTLLTHYENRTYPGLPTLKKLSIMHHLELMNKYLTGSFEG